MEPMSEPPPLKLVVEALVFAAQKPLTASDVRELLMQTALDETAPEARHWRRIKVDVVEEALGELEREHANSDRSYQLQCVGGAWQFVSRPEYGPWLRALLGRKARAPRLSQPALETLTIIAYRQPVTRAEIEQIRGVSVDGVMQTLLERGLIEPVGRAEVVGRPVTFGTTAIFLEYFGIGALEDLPSADELRRIEVQKPEALLTVDAGLATAPPDLSSPAPETAQPQAGEASKPEGAAPPDSPAEPSP
jgi:segregation and condensation protein B